MAGGANKEFIAQGPKFLKHNVVLSPNIQGFLAQKALNAKIAVGNVNMLGVYDFDLRPEPTANCRDNAGKKYKAYKLRLLEERKLINTKVTKDTNAIRAFYLPWDNDRAWTVQLDNRADYVFTPTLDGCSIIISRGANPTISHLNFQNAAKTKVDPAAIDASIAQIYGINSKPGLRKLEKNDYSNDTQKEQGTQFTVTVIGYRQPDDSWEFYYQRQTSSVVPHPSGVGSLVQAVLEDRMVPIT